MDFSGTKVVTNGNSNEAEVQWGLVLKMLIWGAGLAGSVIAVIVTAGILRVFAMSSKIDVIEARQVLVLERVTSAEKAIKDEDYVTHSEFASWMESRARRDAIDAMTGRGNVDDAVAREIKRLEEMRVPK